jgi:hypothetical protein
MGGRAIHPDALRAGWRGSGKVVGWLGRPVPKVRLHLQAAPRSVIWRRHNLSQPLLKTDTGGRFSLEKVSGEQLNACLQQGAYSLLASVHGSMSRCVRVRNDGQEIRIVVGRDVFVSGQVVHPDGSPVKVFRVNGREERGEIGQFSVLTHQPGVERIELSAPGLQTVTVTAPEVPEGMASRNLGAIVLSPDWALGRTPAKGPPFSLLPVRHPRW